jgi:hypothetical protein
MTKRKLKTPKLQNTKTTKHFQSSQEERQIPTFPPCETSHKIEVPQNDKKKN